MKPITFKEVVKDILTQKPVARDNDYILYAYVLNRYGISKNITFWNLQQKIMTNELPTLECIGRVRRKCQELYPSLRATPGVARGRAKKVIDYEELAYEKK